MSTSDYLDSAKASLIQAADEVLRRQVFPGHLRDGEPTKQAFLPTPEHNYLLSTKREVVSPQDAHHDHVDHGLKSCGTWGVRVGSASEVGVPAVDDAAYLKEPHHASLSFLDHETQGKRIQSARKIRDAATCLYLHDAPTAADEISKTA